MKYLKKYQMFFEDGDACVNASNVAGMGDVVNSQPGSLPGTTGTSGSGDVSFGLLKKEKRRRKGNPNQVTDLRDLKEEDTNEIK